MRYEPHYATGRMGSVVPRLVVGRVHVQEAATVWYCTCCSTALQFLLPA